MTTNQPDQTDAEREVEFLALLERVPADEREEVLAKLAAVPHC